MTIPGRKRINNYTICPRCGRKKFMLKKVGIGKWKLRCFSCRKTLTLIGKVEIIQ